METVFNYAQTMLKSHVFKIEFPQKVRKTPGNQRFSGALELRGKDLNQRPPGYEFVIILTIAFISFISFLFCTV